MAMCASGLLVSALVLIIILNDIFSYRIHYLVEHFFLGGIVCTLFFTLCNYGFEQINWIFLALIPVCIFIKWIYTPPSNKDECEVCQESTNTCDCSYRTIQAKVQEQVTTSSKLNCLAKPLTLSTECGISRYY